MKHTRLLFIFLLFSNFVFSQNLQIIKNPFILPHGHTMFALGSLGTSNITNDAANIGLVNPAALNEHKSIKIALSYQFETNIDDAWLTGIGHKRLSKSVPQSGAVIFPIENFRAGLSFKQTYNSKADLGKIEVTTAENPDGIGKFYEPVFETTLFSYSLGTSYKFDRVFTEDASLAIGIRITLNELKYDEGLANYALTFNDRNYNWSAGVIYSHNLPDNKFIKGGLY